MKRSGWLRLLSVGFVASCIGICSVWILSSSKRSSETFLRHSKIFYEPLRPFYNEKKIASSISLVIPCAADDLIVLPMLLTSVLYQTYLPAETIVVVNVGNKNEAEKVALLNFKSVKYNLTQTSEIESDDDDDEFKGREYLKSYVQFAEPLQKLVTEIPNLSIRIRSKPFFAGNNRAFGAKHATNQIISFFDCDDYMLPTRIEYLHKTFISHPELEAVIHGLLVEDVSKWSNKNITRSLSTEPINADEIKFPWTYEDMYKHLPREKYAHLKDGEPLQSGEYTWFFPMYMKLPRRRKTIRTGHNGWLTLKRYVLDEVPYPIDLSRGQDSLYNWRLIQNKRKWNFLPVKLGYYLRHK